MRDFHLLRLVERNARRLLAVTQRRVENPYSVGVVSHFVPFVSCRLLLAADGRHVSLPPEGEEQKKKGTSDEHWDPAYTVSTTLPTFLRSPMKRCASATRSSAKAAETTGRSSPWSTHWLSGSMNSSSVPRASQRRSMLSPMTARAS